MDLRQSKLNDTQIRDFMSKIGNSIIISNEKDKAIVEQLLQYIQLLLNEKNNLFEVCSTLNNETLELQHKVSTEMFEHKKLLNQKDIANQQMKQKNQDLLNVIRETLTKQISASTYPLDEIFDENEMAIFKSTIEQETLNYYSKQVESKEKV